VRKLKSSKCLLGFFAIALVVATATVQIAFALNLDDQTSIIDSIEADKNSSDTTSAGRPKITLNIRITVPHNKNAFDSCRIYPYPVPPPHKKSDPDKIALKDKSLRQMALGMGYWTVSRLDKAFPTGGWRMQYIMTAALKDSGTSRPHSIFTEYGWADNMIPYLRKEAIIVNAKEDDRKKRYDLAQSVFTENHTELEVQAFNQGLFPIDVPIRREAGGYRRGQTVADKANWWIVAFHKVPGLKYYWLWPVKLSDSPIQTVTLDEDNAIYIEGAW